ncbi:MAG: hypothetical protein K0S29_1067 [Gammaproteobacteria bacterium]|nr:hypothetical protein [Gammaproteobacteria bacterium]
MHICFNIAERLGSVYQPSCEKYELIFKHGTSLEAKFMLTREVVFMLQLQLSNLDRKGIIVKESLQSSSIGLFERAWDEAAASNNRAYVEVIDDKLDIVKSEELLSAEDCRKFMDELLYFTFGYVKNKKTNPRDLSASSIIGIRKITCGSPSYSLAMDVTAQKDSTQSVLLVELPTLN